MAQLNGIPQNFTGRIGDFTFYLREGSVCVRSRHNEMRKHTRNEQQKRQSARMGNNVTLWNSFPKGFRPSFQHRRRGTTDYNMFVAYALQASPIYLSRDMVQMGASVLTDVMVSQGSLKEIIVGHDGTAPVTDIALGGLAISSDTTVCQLSKAIVDNNCDYHPGDSLLYYIGEQWIHINNEPRTLISCQQLELDLLDDTPLRLVVGESNGFDSRGGHLAARREVTGGMAWVHTRQTLNGILRSTQRMVCNNDLIDLYGSDEAFAKACSKR